MKLKKFNFKAICFFVTDYLNLHNKWDQHKSDFVLLKTMSKMQVDEWLKNGMKIGSHTASHKNLIKINEDEKISEISRSKSFFKEEFNIDVKFFSYPFYMTIYGSILYIIIIFISYIHELCSFLNYTWSFCKLFYN